jgi:Family of unknown function (DUF6157)
MSYFNTFIQISADSPIDFGEIPVSKNDKKTAHQLQYELLTQRPYHYDHESLIWEIFVLQKDLYNTGEDEKLIIKTNLFSKGHPCLRASSLLKRYGFGAHYNHEGKIALYAADSPEYERYSNDLSLKQLYGMRSARA